MTACVILPLLLGNRVRTDLVACYPDLAVLRRATRAGDWSGVEAYFDALPPRADRSTAVQLVAYSAGSERFLQKAVDTHRDSALARTLLGSRFIVIGWKARTRAWASQVSQAQWRVFLDYLGRAERILADAVAIDPEDSAAWTERITTARGLSLDLDEARRRYERSRSWRPARRRPARQGRLRCGCSRWWAGHRLPAFGGWLPVP
jgi:hypothetical protein